MEKNSHIAGDVPGHKSRLRFVTQPVQFCNNLIHKLMIVHFGLKDPTELPSMIGTEEDEVPFTEIERRS